jgi:hypothetical protein
MEENHVAVLSLVERLHKGVLARPVQLPHSLQTWKELEDWLQTQGQNVVSFEAETALPAPSTITGLPGVRFHG